VVGSMIRPQQELIGFLRIELAPGEARTVIFRFDLNQLAFIGANGHWVVEKGEFRFFVGGHSADVQAEASFQQPRTIEIDHCRRSFFAEATAD